MFTKTKQFYQEFPPTFWTLVTTTFIDRLGGALIFPFFSLYITQKFNVGMTEVGLLFMIFSISGFAGSFLGGAMTDKFGRRAMLIFSLVISSLSNLAMGLVNDLNLFYTFAAVVGILGEAGGPAQQAMVADLLPEHKRSEGFGIIRVSFNLAATIGPAIGGLVASRSFLLLFIIDAIMSLLTAIIVFLVMPETKPQLSEEKSKQSLLQTLGGYSIVFRDSLFMAYLVVSILMTIVYLQMNSTLSVFLRDQHGVSTQYFGYILSMNAAMVVLFQFWVTRRLLKRPPFIMMTLGCALYAIGFAMYGFVSTYPFFFLAMAIITIGEMIVAPVGQALVAQFAPEDMRGRYNAVFGMSWSIPWAFGALLAGIVMDNYNPNWVWYGAGIIGSIATVGFIWLHGLAGGRFTSMEKASIPKTIPATGE